MPGQAGSTSRSLTEAFAGHLAGISYEDIPAASIVAAKQFMLDTLAVGWAGSDSAGCNEARQVCMEQSSTGRSTVWAYGDRLAAPASAFLNGMYAAALDFDSMGRDAPTHVNAVVLPAALAMAERQRSSGKDFLTALVLGADMMARMGAACEAGGVPHKGWYYTSIHGVFGAAAAGAKLLGLDAVAIGHALGLAYSQASGTQQSHIEQSLTKRMQSGFAAQAGVLSALLVQRGISAPREVIEGKFGLHVMYHMGDPGRLLHALGERFENTGFSIKKYPSCGANHTAIEGALQLLRLHDLQAGDIESVEVEISPFMSRLVGGEFDPSGDAQVAAQFSIRYSIACALMRRRFGLAELADEIVRDPAIGALAGRVNVIVDPANSGTRGPVVLRINTRSHGVLSCHVEHEPGSIHAPLTEAEIAAKCEDCFALGAKPLSSEKTRMLMRRLAELESIDDMGQLLQGIV